MARDDLMEPQPSALGNIGQALAAGHLQLRRLATPAQQKLAVTLFDLVERQTFQVAMIEFSNAFLDYHGQAVMRTDDFSCASRPFQVAGIDTVNGFLAQLRGDLFSLAQPNVAQVAVARTLAAMLQIPIGSAVAHKDDLHVGKPRGLARF